MVTRKRRAGCAECGCQGNKKGGYRYVNSKKRTKSRSAKGAKNTKKRRRRRRKRQTKRRRRR
tara:strand:+ start:393 stop:578 length:186 start_codon:yes stop_codon:yes gene_type:complete